ncbi:DUF3100 domain-containing protein [Staphylococcus sp. GDY8P38P]|uniref:DUF3100 domain-containing protein n=1 Tax=Staphylococcus sp. GDY8P38P TaxID=2804116 RepID=UPI001AEC2E4D|nr:DUF3100 domain-containing protein [Staphylococcus sp. GDY8P38P]
MQQQNILWKDWRLHGIVLIIMIISEVIGANKIPLGITSILLLPVVYAVLLGLGVYFTPIIGKRQAKHSEPMVFISVALLIAKFGVEAGPALPKIIAAGPALILQEAGNLATIIISLPLAILLGLRRESIGMTHSIGREPNLALITEKYGITSPEWRGVMSMYIFGTIFGAIFFSIFSGILISILPFSPLAFAMATGVGSGVMTAAALGPLVEMYPDQASTITAFSGVSNLLTSVTGLYVGILIALPLTRKYYSFIMHIKSKFTKDKEQ